MQSRMQNLPVVGESNEDDKTFIDSYVKSQILPGLDEPIKAQRLNSKPKISKAESSEAINEYSS